ncbi:MAG: AMP-binding protein [Thermomicrobiales bacterium]|nr:AMP-binding protein [Thermomicrobiales bacterium]
MTESDRTIDEQVSLIRLTLEACRRRSKDLKLADSTGAELTGEMTLIRAFALRQVLRRDILARDEVHVGVLMPPTVAGAVVNLALTLDRRVPVNLNYVLSAGGLKQSIELAGITHVITSRKVLDRLGLEIDANVVLLEDIPPKVTRRDKAVAGFLGKVAPIPAIERFLGLSDVTADDTFAILFTSGATGEPKGVVLSHRNVGANCLAITDRFAIKREDVLVGVLPFFHAFGLTVALWMPLISDAAAVYHTSPLEPDAIASLTSKYEATILLATPTLLRLYANQIPRHAFASLTTVATGAERLPPRIADQFEETFGLRPFEGYGVTETSPAIAFNVPLQRWHGHGPAPIREGTVGKPIPGVEIRVVDRETGEVLPAGKEGLLHVSGPNVMRGYLHRPELTARVLRDGWYNTGDVVIVDEEGFITITGRESQFSKVAGETVPHLLIEEKIAEVLSAAGGENIHAAVTAVPDARRGERIIVVHQPLSMTPGDVIRGLRQAGLPALYIPSPDSFLEVSEIPMLGSGKVDLRALRHLAEGAYDENGRRQRTLV